MHIDRDVDRARAGVEPDGDTAATQPGWLPGIILIIVNWMDEALLITVCPDHWQAIEKFGITGAMDLAWKPGAASLKLAAELKIDAAVLKDAAQRLKEDPQVKDLNAVYWDDSRYEESQDAIVFTIDRPVSAADHETILRAVRALPGVSEVEKLDGSQDTWRVHVRNSDSATVREQLATLPLRVG